MRRTRSHVAAPVDIAARARLIGLSVWAGSLRGWAERELAVAPEAIAGSNMWPQRPHREIPPVDIPQVRRYSPVHNPQERHTADRLDILQGTLDLMVLRTLFAMGPLHGYGIARRIEQLSGDTVLLNQGTIYVSLVRLENRGWIKSKSGVSENNRRAKFYSITTAGTRQLQVENDQWSRLTAMMERLLSAEAT